MRTPKFAVVTLVLALGGLLAACGDDDGAGIRASGSASGSGTGGSASSTGAAECSPVGEDLEADADETVDIGLVEYAFVPDVVEVDAGVVTFAATNDGAENHEVAFLPGGGDVPFTEDGAPDEDALAEAGAFELEGFGPDQTCNATYELDAGDYTIFCIVEAEDGETHYEKGMRGTLTVT
jgi:plastocyanin